MDRLDEWRLYTSVARLGSFVRAAEQRQVSPQTVTRAIAALEHRLGAKLIHRTTRSVSLTADGEAYLTRARTCLLELDRLEEPLDAAAPLRGALSLTAPVLFGQLHVVPLVTRFLELHPGVEIRLLLVDRVMSLAEEGLDLAVRLGALPDSSLRARRLGTVRSVLCASPGYLKKRGMPRSALDLTKHACIAFTATTPVPTQWSFFGQGGRSRSIPVRPRLVVNTGQAAIDAALLGTGLVRLFSYQVSRLVLADKLKVVLEHLEPAPLPAHLVQLPGGASRAARAFAEFAAPELSQALRGEPGRHRPGPSRDRGARERDSRAHR